MDIEQMIDQLQDWDVSPFLIINACLYGDAGIAWLYNHVVQGAINCGRGDKP